MEQDEIEKWRKYRAWRRVQYRRDHFTKYGVPYGFGVVWLVAALAAFFLADSVEAGGIFGILATGCCIWPTAREIQLGGDQTGQVAAKKSAELDAADVVTPEVSGPPPPGGGAEQPDEA